MVLNDAKIYFAQGSASTATFTKANMLKSVAAYGIPVETVDTVETTVFNTDHVKQYGTGYSDMGEITIKVDLNEDSYDQLLTLRGYMTDRDEVAFGYIVDPELTDLNVKFSGKITSISDIDGDITPGSNAVSTITVKPCTRLSAFTEPTTVGGNPGDNQGDNQDEE